MGAESGDLKIIKIQNINTVFYVKWLSLINEVYFNERKFHKFWANV